MRPSGPGWCLTALLMRFRKTCSRGAGCVLNVGSLPSIEIEIVGGGLIICATSSTRAWLSHWRCAPTFLPAREYASRSSSKPVQPLGPLAEQREILLDVVRVVAGQAFRNPLYQ